MAGTSPAMAFLSRPPARRRQFEAVEIEGRRHCAAGERPIAGALGRLPGARRHDHLRDLAGMDVGTKADNLLFGAIHDFELERRAAIVMPDLDRIDAVPMRALAT